MTGAFINTTKRALRAYPRGVAITTSTGEALAVVLPDADGWFHHAEAVRLQVEASCFPLPSTTP
jgi:hypothetical protein